MTSISRYEAEARALKAHRMATVLRDHGATAETADQLRDEPDWRRAVEVLAQVNPASTATWDMVVRLLAATETVGDATTDALVGAR